MSVAVSYLADPLKLIFARRTIGSNDVARRFSEAHFNIHSFDVFDKIVAPTATKSQ